jgi:hypothetical protein
MSGKMMGAIGLDETITDLTDKLILLGIANRADDDGRNAWPDLAELARWARCSTRTVKRRLPKLEAQGRFTRIRLRRAGKLWRWGFTLRRPAANTEAPPRVHVQEASREYTSGPLARRLCPWPRQTPHPWPRNSPLTATT